MDIHRIGFTKLDGRVGNNGTREPRSGPYRVKCEIDEFPYNGSKLTKYSILFVHGLKGHPRETWEGKAAASKEDNLTEAATTRKRKRTSSLCLATSSASTASNEAEENSNAKIFWPNDYLTEDIPEARIWTYGYNADVIGGMFAASNQNTISQHSQDLAVRVAREIENEVGRV